MKNLVFMLLSFITFAAQAQDVTQPPAGAQARYTVTGKGVQIYGCTVDGKWVLQEPQADLIDQQTKEHVGTHSKGPIWTWSDGSILLGQVMQQKASADSIPWLLLSVTSTGKKGALSDIAYVRRSDTQGGKVPASAVCGVNNIDEQLRVPYAATYTFYSTS
jgi:hypothetical protein